MVHLTNTIFICALSALTLNYVIAGDGIDMIHALVDEGRMITVPCVLKLHELYFHSNESIPGATYIINILPFASKFQQNIMFGLSSLDKDYHNSSLIIRFSWSEYSRSFGTLGKASEYILFLNRTSDVEYTLLKWQSSETWNSNAPVLVILYRVVDQAYIADEIKRVFQTFLNFHMLNIYFIYNDKDSQVTSIFTYYPYEGTSCARRVERIHLLDTCDNLQKFDEKVGPRANPLKFEAHAVDKIPWNFHGCPIRVSTTNWEPFSFTFKSFVGGKLIDVWSGIEVYILENIGKKLNMTIQFIKNDESRTNMIFNKQYGLYSHLFQGEAHVLIGGLELDAGSAKYLSSSTPYYSDDQTWCVARVRPTSKWKNIFNIFTLELWIAIFCALFVMTFTLNIFLKIERRDEDYSWQLLKSLLISMGQMPAFWPKLTPARFVYFLFLLYGFMINAAFNCFLIGTLTQYRTNEQVRTLNETIENDFSYAGGLQTITYYPVGDPVADYIRQRYRVCSNIDICLSELITNTKLAVALSRQHALNNRAVDKSHIFCFDRKHDIYSYSVSIIATYDFPLLSRIDYVIRLLYEGGLIFRWKEANPYEEVRLANILLPQFSLVPKDSGAEKDDAEQDGDNANVETYSNQHRSESEQFVNLTIDHILGALIILIVGQSSAFVVFIYEYWTLNEVRKKSAPVPLYPYLN